MGGYPGPDGGRLIAELIMGDREPIGRLPVSLPRSSASLPVAYDERMGAARRYSDSESDALLGFGAGLGYARWELGEPAAVGDGLSDVVVSAVLRNTSERAGRQIVGLYGRARVPGLLPRQAVLLGFTAVEVAAGGEQTVSIGINPYAIGRLGLDAPPSATGLPASLELWLSHDSPLPPRGQIITHIVGVSPGPGLPG
ncbi:hypothetical protein GJV80_12975 [Microlunatus sp. Gsoil 973]|nr:glycoside hydrolase family 3 C-terminal domain-containing protein [Microlunatus sp. Gsoil 973]QGN33571.1 hypothetical protein GJV80_12975 [Microlunatus sp. Gsoil 973]